MDKGFGESFGGFSQVDGDIPSRVLPLTSVITSRHTSLFNVSTTGLGNSELGVVLLASVQCLPYPINPTEAVLCISIL